MLAIKNLQETIHGHSITAIEAMQMMKIRFQQSLKNEDIPDHFKLLIHNDIRRIDVQIDWILDFQTMGEFYETGTRDFPKAG